MSQQAISKIETGETAEPGRILALARALRVRAEWLDTGEGPMDAAADAAVAELAARIAAASPRDRRLIELALLNPDEPLPEGISPSIRQLLDVVRTMIPEER